MVRAMSNDLFAPTPTRAALELRDEINVALG